MCAFIEGVPMLYQGDEDPAVYKGSGVSSVGFLSQVYGVRRSVRAISRGSADYSSVTASGGVFACLRKDAGETAVVLISFSPSAVQSTVSLPESAVGTWVDKLSGEKVEIVGGKANVGMGAYQVRVLVRLGG
jgi:hypothetical protein